MNSVIKSRLAAKMRLAHCIARQLTGDYSARMSYALKVVNREELNTAGFDSIIHTYGSNKYWINVTEFNCVCDEAIAYVKQELVNEAKLSINWWGEKSEEEKKSYMVKGLFARNPNSLSEIEIKYLFRNEN